MFGRHQHKNEINSNAVERSTLSGGKVKNQPRPSSPFKIVILHGFVGKAECPLFSAVAQERGRTTHSFISPVLRSMLKQITSRALGKCGEMLDARGRRKKSSSAAKKT